MQITQLWNPADTKYPIRGIFLDDSECGEGNWCEDGVYFKGTTGPHDLVRLYNPSQWVMDRSDSAVDYFQSILSADGPSEWEKQARKEGKIL